MPTINLNIDKGTDFSANVTIKHANSIAINVTSYDFYSDIKQWSGSDNVLCQFSISKPDPVNGVISLNLTHDQTGLFEPNFRYVYDILMDRSNNISKICEGQILVSNGVTII